jgi:DNA-binding NarL/FixJ family response regulator
MADVTPLLDEARAAFSRRDWVRACNCFSAVREQTSLSADDLFALGDSAWWLGILDTSRDAFEHAYGAYLGEGRPAQAAMAALNIAYTLSLRGEGALASGWLSRAGRLLQEVPECAEHGYLLYIGFESAFAGSDLNRALNDATSVEDVGRRFRDPNLIALGVLGKGRVLIKQGQVREGMALVDEAMLAALSDDLDPAWAGNIYCHLIAACYELGDLRRAGEWTEATASWCEALPGAGPFMGICRVHRAQLLQFRGEWDQVEREAARVCAEFGHFHVAIVGEAHYQIGEVCRQRGELNRAEEAFKLAHQWGREPQPGLALLRLMQGRTASARTAIDAAVAGITGDRLARVRLLSAQVEIALSQGDVEAAGKASRELDEIAEIYGGAAIRAGALQARGAVLSAEGSTGESIQVLREALAAWQELNAPYDAARVRLLLASAAEEAGASETAALELDAAEAVFGRLGARLDLATVGRLRRPALPGGLSQREVEVLGLIAEGKTNREIAEAMVISTKTVARHLSNIFTKLGVSSRTAAAAYAYEQGLVSRGTHQRSTDG